MKVVFKDEIVKFSKNCDTFAIKESGGGESTNYGQKVENFKNGKMIINCHNGSGKPRKFSKYRMNK